jgi:ribosomal protein L37E
MKAAKENERIMRPRDEPNVTVQCLRCGHTGLLTREALLRFSIQPDTPIAAFVKRLRCRRCGSRSVLATRNPPPRNGTRPPTRPALPSAAADRSDAPRAARGSRR